MGTGEFNAGGNPAMDWHPIQGGVEIFLVASCHGNRDKLRPGGPLGSYADFLQRKQTNEKPSLVRSPEILLRANFAGVRQALVNKPIKAEYSNL